MKVTVLCDDFWHPGSVVHGGMDPLASQGWEFEYVMDASTWSPVRLSEPALTVLAKSDNTSQANKDPWMTPEIQQALVDHVRSGHGLLVLHSGTCYAQHPILRPILGGVFETHPAQCPVTIEPVADHALTAGASAFTAQDEHYQMIMDTDDVDIFATGTSEHGTQPAGWTYQVGQGRVCVLTPGHNLDVWLQPGFQALLQNALTWCA